MGKKKSRASTITGLSEQTKPKPNMDVPSSPPTPKQQTGVFGDNMISYYLGHTRFGFVVFISHYKDNSTL